jgi:hypothetical protein
VEATASLTCREVMEGSNYYVAGRVISTNVPLITLKAFTTTDTGLSPKGRGTSPTAELRDAQLVYQGEGWVGDRQRALSVWGTNDGYRIQINGVGDFAVGAEPQRAIEAAATAPEANARAFSESALGPPLILALALRGVWCLHASSVILNGRVIVFLGESGRGKSTLAAYLDRSPTCQRVADDLLLVTGGAEGLTCWPRFPQAKLSVAEQYPSNAAEQLPVDAICELGDAAPNIECPTIGQAEAAQVLIRHSVSARCFGPKLLAPHLSFCAHAAERVRAHRLRYPREFELLPRVRQVLEELG